MLQKVLTLLSSTKVALVLLVLIIVACIIGVVLPRSVSKEAIFWSLWFNILLILLIVNIVFCITEKIRFLHVSQAGTTLFHLGLVVLFVGVVYDQLFFFEGTISLTEGETINCADGANWSWVEKGRFFPSEKLNELGDLYFHGFHSAPYVAEGKDRGVATEIAVGEDIKKGRTWVVYVTRPLKYKGFDFYHSGKHGYSPLFVLRDKQGTVLCGNFAPLQTVKQQDGTYLYRSGTDLPGSFPFPQDPRFPAVFKLQAVYYPDKVKKREGGVLFQVWPLVHGSGTEKTREKELFNGKAAFRERVNVGDYLLSMDEVRHWTTLYVNYRPGMPAIFGSFWIVFGGLVLNLIQKTAKRRREEGLTG